MISIRRILLIAIVAAAAVERLFLDLGPNVELITAATVAASIYLTGFRGGLIALGLLIGTDLVLGNTSIALFTWSGFAIPALTISRLKRHFKSGKRRVFLGTAAGVGANLFFYIWTNFGVWYTDLWGMYPDTLDGLALSYINGLPFLRNQLVSTVYFLPLVLGVFEKVADRSFIVRLRPFAGIITKRPA